MKARTLIYSSLALITFAGSLNGANYYLHTNMPSGTSWVDKASWFDNPTSGSDMGSETFGGNHFFLNGYDLRTGNTGTSQSSFNGSSLNMVAASERLDLMALTTNILQTFNVSGGGAALVHATRSAVTLNVETLNSSGLFGFRANNTDESLALVVTTLVGDGDIIFGNRGSTAVDEGNYSINVTNSSGFSGRIVPDDGVLTLSSADFSTATLFLDTVNSTKAGIVNIATSASFAAIEGSSLSVAAGTYTAAELNTLFDDTRFSGAGTLTIVPEPSTFALLAGALCLGLAMLVKRRKA